MPGLPHTKNSKASQDKYEPVYLNLFEVIVTPPPSIGGGWDLMMDNVTKVSGLDVDKTPAPVEQIYKGAKRRYAGGFPDSTTVDLTIGFEVNVNSSNSMYIFNELRKWCDLIFDPLTGAMSLKVDYAGGPMTVSLFNKKGDVFRQWIFPVIFPMSSLPAMELDYANGASIWQMDVTFASDFWEDMRV